MIYFEEHSQSVTEYVCTFSMYECVYVLEEHNKDIVRQKIFDKHEMSTILVFVSLPPKILVKYNVRIVHCVCAVLHLHENLTFTNYTAGTL